MTQEPAPTREVVDAVVWVLAVLSGWTIEPDLPEGWSVPEGEPEMFSWHVSRPSSRADVPGRRHVVVQLPASITKLERENIWEAAAAMFEQQASVSGA